MTEKSTDLKSVIRGCVLFSGASDDSLQRLADSSTLTQVPAKTDLFFAGDEPDGLHIVVSGLARIWINDSDGREFTFVHCEAGDAFGEIALLDGRPRSTNATVIEKSEILLLTRPAFQEVLDQDISLSRYLIETLCEMLRRTNKEMQEMAFLDLGSRLARKLHELAIAHAIIDGRTARFERKFSQTQLAHMLGATREAINKRHARLVSEGMLHMEKGRIVIPDLDALTAWANSERRD